MSQIDPHLFVIFGATGDLTKRKLIPALYHLMQDEDVARRCVVLGAARSDWTDERFREAARTALREQGYAEETVAEWCTQSLHYQCLGATGDDYSGLRDRIEQIERHRDLPGNRAFYLSLPPSS